MDDVYRRNRKSRSMMHRILFGLIALFALQALLLLYLFKYSGTIEQLDTAAYSALVNQLIPKKNKVENLLLEKREGVERLAVNISGLTERTLGSAGADLSVLSESSAVVDEIMSGSLAQLERYVRLNTVTGAFMIVDGPETLLDKTKASRSAIYLRNPEPKSAASENISPVLEYGESSLAGEIPLSPTCSSSVDFSDESSGRDFYYKPLEAATGRAIDMDTLRKYCYWSPPFKMKPGERPVITYSLPLFLSNGELYGVLGFELEESFVRTLIPTEEISFDNGLFLLGTATTDDLFGGSMISSIDVITDLLESSEIGPEHQVLYETDKGAVHKISAGALPVSEKASQSAYIGGFEEMQMYDRFSSFYDEKWMIGYVASEAEVMAQSNRVKSAVILSVGATLIMALFLTLIVLIYTLNPIRSLAEKVRRLDPEKPVRFERTGIRELDDLSGAFEILSDELSKAGAKMFGIIELVNMPIGSFEINYKDDTVHLSKSLFSILDLKEPDDGLDTIPAPDWYNQIGKLEIISSFEGDENITETLYTSAGPTKKWLRMRMLAGDSRDMGVMIDVTDEITHQQKLEYERNSDPLTKLLNRRAFISRALKIMGQNAERVCLLMFADLDGLKAINDMYGHDTGDSYIVSFARFLNRFMELGRDAAVGRMSGDEFVLFIGGFDTREEARSIFDSIFNGLPDNAIYSADGEKHIISASAGISYYPSDTKDINDLLKYADYAMYEIKHTKKGEVRDFDKKSYETHTAASNESGILNLIFEKRRVSFVFQPIAEVATGEVYAYEALMRPSVREFKTPREILKLARSLSKLYQVEKLTFDVLLDWILKNQNDIDDKKIFVNSLPGQMFSASDLTELSDKYSHLYDRIVLDLIDNDFSNKKALKHKTDFFRLHGSMIAFEGFGSGDSNHVSQLIKPDFIKIDRSIVCNVNNDLDKQQLVQSMVSFSSKRGMKVVSVGIETPDELESVISLGVHYVQGYYIARPRATLRDIPAEKKNEIVRLSGGRTA